MPIEIRELIIKTEVRSQFEDDTIHGLDDQLKESSNEILDNCKRMIATAIKRSKNQR